MADKSSALNAALAQIEKQYGKGAVMRLGQNTEMNRRYTGRQNGRSYTDSKP